MDWGSDSGVRTHTPSQSSCDIHTYGIYRGRTMASGHQLKAVGENMLWKDIFFLGLREKTAYQWVLGLGTFKSIRKLVGVCLVGK